MPKEKSKKDINTEIKRLSKKSLQEIENLCKENRIDIDQTKENMILELAQYLNEKTKKLMTQQKDKQTLTHPILAPLDTKEKFWKINYEGTTIINIFSRYFQSGISCKRSVFIPRYSNDTYKYFFSFKESHGKMRKTTCRKRRNGTKEERNIYHHTWKAIYKTVYELESKSEKKEHPLSQNNGFPSLDILNTNYWVKDTLNLEKKLKFILQELKFQFNTQDEELKIIWKYEIYYFQDNLWNKIQGN